MKALITQQSEEHHLTHSSEMQNTLEVIKPDNCISILKNSFSFKKIREYDKIGYLIIPICNKHFALFGFKNEIDPFTKEEIAKYTALHCKSLSIEEIELAFENERFGLMGNKTEHYQLFSIDYYVQIINKYKKWKAETMIEKNIEEPAVPIIQLSESNYNEEQRRKEMAEEAKQKGVAEFSWIFYDKFLSEGKINPTDEFKKKLYQEQLTAYEKELSTGNFYKGNTLKQKLKDLKKEIENKEKNGYVIARCKSIIVSEYLKQE